MLIIIINNLQMADEWPCTIDTPPGEYIVHLVTHDVTSDQVTLLHHYLQILYIFILIMWSK